jgi:hypothetical protein
MTSLLRDSIIPSDATVALRSRFKNKPKHLIGGAMPQHALLSYPGQNAGQMSDRLNLTLQAPEVSAEDEQLHDVCLFAG